MKQLYHIEDAQAFDGFIVGGRLWVSQSRFTGQMIIPVNAIDPDSDVKKPGDYGALKVWFDTSEVRWMP